MGEGGEVSPSRGTSLHTGMEMWKEHNALGQVKEVK